jgi:two-component system chemotaxis response regulator CheB
MEQLNSPSGYGCPECGGALWEVKDDQLVRYRCRVGHAYSADSLLVDQGETAERALWSAARALQESAEVCRRLARSAPAPLSKHYKTRAGQREHDAEVIRQLLKSG